MSIVRAPRPAGNFTLIPNDTLRDANLSYRARGILAAILSRPDNWRTTTEDLATQGAEGRDAIRSAFTELENAGYIRRVRRQGDRGRWATEIHVFDSPATANTPAAPTTDSQASETPDTPSPTPEKPTVGEPGANERTITKNITPGGSNHQTARETAPPSNPDGGAPERRTPPQHELGGRRPDPGHDLWRADRCQAHQHTATPPACGGCKDARLAVERAAVEAVHAAAQRQREADDAARAARRAEIARCSLCDDHGYAGRILCTHDPDAETRVRRHADRIRDDLRRQETHR